MHKDNALERRESLLQIQMGHDFRFITYHVSFILFFKINLLFYKDLILIQGNDKKKVVRNTQALKYKFFFPKSKIGVSVPLQI